MLLPLNRTQVAAVVALLTDHHPDKIVTQILNQLELCFRGYPQMNHLRLKNYKTDLPLIRAKETQSVKAQLLSMSEEALLLEENILML